MNGMIAHVLALEEIADGTTKVEDEVVLYACVKDMSVLSKAESFEDQEQWEIKIWPTSWPRLPNAYKQHRGCVRVRKTVADGKTQYVQTIKSRKDDSNAKDETSFEVTEDVFDQIKQLSSSGMIKRRYIFPIEGRPEKFEVDVFPLPDGKLANWVKIDLEWAPKSAQFLRVIPPLPEGFTDVINGNTKEPEEQEFIQKLYNEVFLKKNESNFASS